MTGAREIPTVARTRFAAPTITMMASIAVRTGQDAVILIPVVVPDCCLRDEVHYSF